MEHTQQKKSPYEGAMEKLETENTAMINKSSNESDVSQTPVPQDNKDIRKCSCIRDNYKCICCLLVFIGGFIGGSIYGFYDGITKMQQHEAYAFSATPEQCVLLSSEPADRCPYKCDCTRGGECSTCYAAGYLYTATAVDKCDDVILNIKADECTTDLFDLDEDRHCFVLDCTHAEFTFTDHEKGWNDALVTIIVCSILILLPCCGITFGCVDYHKHK
eukprot:35144_1